MDEGNYPDDDNRFGNAPYFNFNDGKVKFDTNWVSNANGNYGSSSGFVPKSLLRQLQRTSIKMSFVLVSTYGPYPTAEHSTDLIDCAF